MYSKKGKIIPLKIKLIISFSIMVIISLLIQVGISYFFFYDVIENKTVEYFQQTITQANSRIDASLYSYEKITRNIIANINIQKSLQQLQSNEQSLVEANYTIKQELAEITISEFNINSIQIIPKGLRTINYIFTSNYADYNDIKEMPWFEEVNNSTGQLLWLPTTPTYKAIIGKSKTHVFSAIRKINSIDTGEELAIMILNIDEKHLRYIMNEVELGENGRVYLVNQDNVIISYRDEKQIGKTLDIHLMDNKKNMIITDESTTTHWKIIGVVPKTEYTSDIEQVNRIFLYLSCIAIIVIIVFALATSTSIVRPIKAMISGMKEVRKGNLNIHIDHHQNNELGILTDHFNMTIEELRFFIDKVYKQEISRRESELKALQAQLNPHFLYNTLDTIYWMLIIKEEEEIGDLVVALADILRYSIGDGKEFVTVEQDIQQLKNYLSIQKARFNEKLNFVIEVDTDIQECLIPKLLIQPLVENSINHGFNKMRVEGKIIIRGFQEEDKIIFEVMDNGIGLSHEKIKEIFRGKVKTDKKHTGLGLKAVDSRIKLLYGEEYGIQISSQPDKETIIRIKLNKVVSGREL